jgi:uncharacterized membrane protein (DUF2068 family)
VVTISVSSSAAARPDLLAERGVVLVHGVDDDRVLQVVGVPQFAGQIDVDLARVSDVDPDQAAAARVLQQPGHLEPAELQLVGNLDLGLAVQVVPPGHGGGEHQLGRADFGSHRVPPTAMLI